MFRHFRLHRLHDSQKVKRLKRNAYKHDNQTRHQRKRRRQKPSSSFWSSLADIQTKKNTSTESDIIDAGESRLITNWRRFGQRGKKTEKPNGRENYQNKDDSALEMIIHRGDDIAGLERILMENGDILSELLSELLKHYYEVKQVKDSTIVHVESENEKYKDNYKLIKILNDLHRENQVK